jgi:hypothetical protein
VAKPARELPILDASDQDRLDPSRPAGIRAGIVRPERRSGRTDLRRLYIESAAHTVAQVGADVPAVDKVAGVVVPADKQRADRVRPRR